MKLTKQLKEKIAEDILNHRFKADEQKLKAERHALAVAIYNERYNKADRDLMATLEDGWLPESDDFRARIGGNFDVFILPEKKRFRYRDGQHRFGPVLVAIDEDHKLSKRYDELTGREGDAKKARKASEVDVWAILNSVSTVDKLRDRWPEAIKIIDPIIATVPKSTANLPAIPMPELNARLKLPPKSSNKS